LVPLKPAIRRNKAMRYLKKLSMALVAILALSAFAGASRAATALCDDEGILDTNEGTDSLIPATVSLAGEIDATYTVNREEDGCEPTAAKALACGQSKVSHEVTRRDISLL
jgi:hypothetical protein